MKLPHPIPYQGSKRNLAGEILRFFPTQFDRLIEPFCGSAAITIASAYYGKADRFLINDVNLPLIDLLDAIINDPKYIIKSYHDQWHEQLGREEAYYYEVREKFNRTKKPEHLLFLLAKCVKAAVRYNANGHFNQSLDKRRLGRNPQLMRSDILEVSQLLKGKVELNCTDYSSILHKATSKDLIYMDPPYQGTGLNGGFNYVGNIQLESFINSLHDLNERNISFILSFDGRTGSKLHGMPLPVSLNLSKIEINAGRSSQATLLNRKENTYEALYISSSLARKIDLVKLITEEISEPELFMSNA
jgi:DNA adenine methylase